MHKGTANNEYLRIRTSTDLMVDDNGACCLSPSDVRLRMFLK